MKGIFWYLVAVNVLVASGIAAYAGACAVGIASLDDLRWAADAFRGQEGSALVIGGSVLFLAHNVFFLLYPLLSHRDDVVVARTEGAQVTIALSAIEASLARAASNVDDVSRVTVVVRPSAGPKRPLRVTCRYATREGVDVPRRTEELKAVLRERFRKIVGDLEIPPEYAIHLSRILAPEEARDAAARPDEEAKVDYRRPEYPIDAPF